MGRIMRSSELRNTQPDTVSGFGIEQGTQLGRGALHHTRPLLLPLAPVSREGLSAKIKTKLVRELLGRVGAHNPRASASPPDTLRCKRHRLSMR